MNFEEFDVWFDRFEQSVFRLETLQRYSVPGEDKRLRAFREGTPRPERSVRNDPWLRRLALTTAAGKRWQRVHIVEPPLTEYLHYELVSYVESAATGEDIWIAERAVHPALAELNEDFWLFDAENERAYAVIPADAQMRAVPWCCFTLYEDRADDQPPFVAMETAHAGLLVSDPKDVAIYRRQLELFRKSAIFGDEARDMLIRIAHEQRHASP